MKLTQEKTKDELIVTVTLSHKEIASVQLDQFERALHQECIESGKASDILLMLEEIARRIESRYEKDEVRK